MPVEKTAKLWIQNVEMPGVEKPQREPMLYFYDDGSAPYWSDQSNSARAIIPSSSDNALAEGLVILWASFIGEEGNLGNHLNIFNSSPTPIHLSHRPISDDLLEIALKWMEPFTVHVSAEKSSYVMVNPELANKLRVRIDDSNA